MTPTISHHSQLEKGGHLRWAGQIKNIFSGNLNLKRWNIGVDVPKSGRWYGSVVLGGHFLLGPGEKDSLFAGKENGATIQRGSPPKRDRLTSLVTKALSFCCHGLPYSLKYLCFFLIKLPSLLKTKLNCWVVVKNLQISDQQMGQLLWDWDRIVICRSTSCQEP